MIRPKPIRNAASDTLERQPAGVGGGQSGRIFDVEHSGNASGSVLAGPQPHDGLRLDSPFPPQSGKCQLESEQDCWIPGPRSSQVGK